MNNDKLTSEYDKSYQKRLINQIIMEQKFASTLLPIIDPLYFDDEMIKLIIRTLKDAYTKDDTVLNFETLNTRVVSHKAMNTPIKKERAVKIIDEIKVVDSNDFEFVRNRALIFCKQQEIRKAAKKVLKIADADNPEAYYECENIIKEALEKGNEDDNGIDVAHNLENVLSEDFRNPIPTGITGLDECMGGGLSKKEVALVIAPSGVGKTTLTTKISNEAFNAGKNVVQLFFEDTEEQIQRKHYTCWTGIESKDLFSRRDEVIKTVNEKTDRENKLILLKLPSFGTTMRSINQALKKIIANGTPIDMVILDYIDCVQADKAAKDVHEGEGLTMRQFETMVSELNIAGWVATQGNRDSMSSEIVQASQTGGSIKKVQIGHFVMSIAKTLEQREEGVANIAILKSRFGKDGVTFTDCRFDNATMTIDTNTQGMGYGDWQQAKSDQIQNTIVNAIK